MLRPTVYLPSHLASQLPPPPPARRTAPALVGDEPPVTASGGRVEPAVAAETN